MNSLQRAVTAQEDHRQIITISLNRKGRGKYWEFHCPFCTKKVCELEGTMVYASDVWNDTKTTPVLIRCPGTEQKWCRYWYGFLLSD